MKMIIVWMRAFLTAEEIALLRREIAHLSSSYRDIVIRYYYDNASVADIAKEKNAALGTVKWWLFEARQQILTAKR